MLTRKQLELLRFIHERLKETGIPPSFDEMKDALDLASKSGIHRLITALEERGFIRRLADRAAVRSLNDADTRGSLSQINVPTLVIAGEEDGVTPPQESEILAKGISDSTLSLIPGAGHFSMLENPV